MSDIYKQENKICVWCGSDHDKTPPECERYGNKAAELIQKGVPTPTLFTIIRKYGLRALDDFEVYAKAFLKSDVWHRYNTRRLREPK